MTGGSRHHKRLKINELVDITRGTQRASKNKTPERWRGEAGGEAARHGFSCLCVRRRQRRRAGAKEGAKPPPTSPQCGSGQQGGGAAPAAKPASGRRGAQGGGAAPAEATAKGGHRGGGA